MDRDTIAAIATALSPSGIGIIRISGPEAVKVADSVFRSKKVDSLEKVASHTIHYGFIYDGEEIIDEVMVAIMLAPNSFTREDTVEIDCHGGVFVMNRILSVVLKHGAKMAQPGEFTKRAFLNGRIDLTKAESVMDLIQSKNEFALKSSIAGLRGGLYNKIKDIRGEILYELSFIEAALDDPEHISLDGYPEKLEEKVNHIIQVMKKYEKQSDNGRILKEGINTVIVGKPNAGKSSLLNYFAGEERAIVTDVAGTTRDLLVETIQMDSITLNITDTAGIHFTEDYVEQIGVQKAKKSIEDADLILYMMDSSLPLNEDDEEISRCITDKKKIVLLNKSDLQPILDVNEVEKKYEYVIKISATKGLGLDELRKLICDMFFEGEITFNDEYIVTNMRQKEAISEAIVYMENCLKSIQDQMPEDFYSIDLAGAYASLGRVIGEEVGDDLVEEIFSKFCMGK